MTVPEIRVLKEGQKHLQDERKAQQRAMKQSGDTNSGEVSETRKEIAKSQQKSDKALVESLNSQN